LAVEVKRAVLVGKGVTILEPPVQDSAVESKSRLEVEEEETQKLYTDIWNHIQYTTSGRTKRNRDHEKVVEFRTFFKNNL